MAYCRWSSDEFKSDVYMFEDVAGGYTFMIAERRYTDNPMKSKYKHLNLETENRLRDKILVPLNLPLAGKQWSVPTLEDALNVMYELREDGYHVPEVGIQRIKAELNCQK